MIGEIGGPDEAEAAQWCKANMKKPIVGFIAGVTAPAGKRMGHAGALISGGADTADAKLAIMEECGLGDAQPVGNGQAAEGDAVSLPGTGMKGQAFRLPHLFVADHGVSGESEQLLELPEGAVIKARVLLDFLCSYKKQGIRQRQARPLTIFA